VTGIDREIVQTVTKDFSSVEMAGKTMLYREEERRFAIGDRIIALKNDRELRVQNGSLSVMKDLDEKGRALVDLGRSLSMKMSHLLCCFGLSCRPMLSRFQRIQGDYPWSAPVFVTT
jgi:hypothetical protein